MRHTYAAYGLGSMVIRHDEDDIRSARCSGHDGCSFGGDAASVASLFPTVLFVRTDLHTAGKIA